MPASFTSCSRVLGSSRACCTNVRGLSNIPEMVVMVDSPSTRASVAAATGARAQAPAHVREHNSTGRLCQAAAAATMDNMGAVPLARLCDTKMQGNGGLTRGRYRKKTLTGDTRNPGATNRRGAAQPGRAQT